MTTVIGMLFVTVVGNIKWMGGYQGISSVPPPNAIGSIVFDNKVDFYFLGLILLVIIVLVINAFYASWAGRAWNAIGLNPRLAQSMGVNVFRYRLLSFVVACAIAGLVGSFYAHYQAYINPSAFNLFPKTIFVQAVAVLGGVAFATLGPIVGAALLTFFTELVSGYNVLSIILVGAMIVLVVIFLPGGVLSLFQLPGKLLASRRKPTAASVAEKESELAAATAEIASANMSGPGSDEGV